MTSLPVLSSISTFLSGTINEEFKKLVKPASLVLAGIFTVLNLVFILPTLRLARLAQIAELEALPTAWQLALGTLAIITLAYLFSNLGESFIGLAKGNAVEDVPLLNSLLRWIQKGAYQSHIGTLKNHANDLDDEGKKIKAARATHQLAYSFPDSDSLTLTRLGNVIASAASYTWSQYGANLNVLWPIMDHVLEKEDPELQKRVIQNFDSLTFLVSLSVLIKFFALEYAIVKLLFTPLIEILWVIVPLLIAYMIYLAGLQKAESWSRDIRTAFDLYLPKLEESLKLRELKGYDLVGARKVRLRGVSQWLAYGGLKLPDSIAETFNKPDPLPDWYAEKPGAAQISPLVLAPPTVNVIQRHQLVQKWGIKRTHQNPNEWLLSGNEIEYVFAVTNTDSGQGAQDAKAVFLLVSDERLPAVPQQVSAVVTGKTPAALVAERQKSEPGKPEALLWDLGDIPVRGSHVIRYRIRSELRLKANLAGIRIGKPAWIDTETLTFKVTSTLPNIVDIQMSLYVVNADQLPAEVRISGGNMAPVQFNPTNNCGEWTLRALQPGVEYSLVMTLKQVVDGG